MNYFSARNQLNINYIVVVIALPLVAMADVYAQTCPTVSSDTTVTSSCDTGITLTGNNNLTIGTPTSGPVEVSNPGSTISIGVTGTGNTIINTASGEISAVVGSIGIYNDGTINTLTNSGTISVGNFGYGIFNSFTGTITTLTNSGTISAGNFGIGIINDGTGTITTLTNSSTISAGTGGIGIINEGTIDTLTNLGTISAGDNGYGIANDGAIGTLTNSGTISVGTGGFGIDNVGTINTLTNSGVISALTGGIALSNVGAITLLDNSGTITAGFDGRGINNTGTVSTLANSGTISAGDGGLGIFNTFSSTIGTLINSGTISVGNSGVGIVNVGTIDTLTNSGTISVGNSGVGIVNLDTIGTLNNAQGGNGATSATTALTYSGNLPTNYNMVISSATRFGQLAVTDPVGSITNFAILGTPLITTRKYAGVLSGTAAPTGVSSGTIDNMRWSLTANGAAFDLTFVGASLIGTQQSLINTANALAPVYALQNAVLSNGFSYDCPVFGEHNVCVTAGGRNTAVSAANGLNNTSALLIAAYRIKPTLRVGAYADQNLSVNNAGGTVNLGNSTPLIGLYGVWNQRLDNTGTEVKVAAAYGQKNTSVNRQIVGLSEAGTGSSNLNSQGAQIIVKYGFAVVPDVLVSPYVGVSYTQNNMGGYTESTSAQVTDPLTYSALNTNATTALAGFGAAYRFIFKATLFASARVATDINTSNGTYSATGITGLIPVNFNPNPVKTRRTATLGAYYDIVKNQRIGIMGIYRKESYKAISTSTVMATYTVGF